MDYHQDSLKTLGVIKIFIYYTLAILWSSTQTALKCAQLIRPNFFNFAPMSLRLEIIVGQDTYTYICQNQQDTFKTV